MAIILTCYYRPKPGGFCRRLFRAIEALLSAGHSVHYLSLAPFPINHPQCVFHRFPWPLRKADTLLFWSIFYLTAPLILAAIALRHRITHAFGFSPVYAFFMKPIRWIRPLALTCFLRADLLAIHRIKDRPPWFIALERFVEGQAIHGARVVGVTTHLTETITMRHPNSIPHTQIVLFNDLMPTGITRITASPERLSLAMVGILEKRKNQAFILQLLRNISHQNWHLYIYGVGPDEKQLIDLAAKLEISSKITFKGWVPQDQIWPQTDLLLMPSLHEGMPNAILEAIANQVPVLASDIDAHRELLPGFSRLPLSLESWRCFLDKILSGPEPHLKRIQRRQFEFAKRLRFDWNKRVVEIIVPSAHQSDRFF